jgi:hypothetical protein
MRKSILRELGTITADGKSGRQLRVYARSDGRMIATPSHVQRSSRMASVKGPFVHLSILPITLDDHHSVMATALSTIPSAMQTTVMFAVSELGAGAAKTTISIHIAVASNPNAEFLRIRYGRSSYRKRGERGKSISEFLHVSLLHWIGEKTAMKKLRSGKLLRIF